MNAPNDRKVIKFQASIDNFVCETFANLVTYLNDISCTMKNTEIKIFADDVTVYKIIRSIGNFEALRHDLDSICHWCSL